MVRALLSLGVLIALQPVAAAQHRTAAPPGHTVLSPGVVPQLPESGFGGGVRHSAPGSAVLGPGIVPQLPRRGGITGGFVPAGSRRFGVWGGFGGGWPYGYGYDDWVDGPVFVQGPPMGPPYVLSKEYPATLTLEFPAPAEVWVDGYKGAGDPATEWTLTSPVLSAGGQYKFNVKGQWKVGGKTFDYERSFTVVGGNHSRVIVVSGTAAGP